MGGYEEEASEGTTDDAEESRNCYREIVKGEGVRTLLISRFPSIYTNLEDCVYHLF